MIQWRILASTKTLSSLSVSNTDRLFFFSILISFYILSSVLSSLPLQPLSGDIFTQEPTLERDVRPVLHLLQQYQPDVVGVALDPEASGPDTHYKVLQTITEALSQVGC